MSADGVRAIVTQVVASGVPLHWSTYLLILLISLLASGFGAWLGSYLREKGKHLATREDIDEIVDQLQKTTRAAEEIKAQISGELWVGQRRRELQLEVLKELNIVFTKTKLAFGSPTADLSPEEVERLYCAAVLARALFKSGTIKAFSEAIENLRLDPTGRLRKEFVHTHAEAIKAMVDEVCQSQR